MPSTSLSLVAENAYDGDSAPDRRSHSPGANVAGEIQRSWLPTGGVISTPRVVVACESQPVHECGGDLCAVYALGEAVLVVIGDVTGHAYDAALLCAVAKGACDVAVREVRPLSAPRLLELLNTIVRNAARGRLTMTCSVALVASRTMTVASAGHPLPYVVRNRDGQAHIEGVSAFGDVLGTAVSSSYETTTVPLRPGDRVLWYTDGVTDCENEDGARFGHRRIRGLLDRADGIGAGGLVRELSAEIKWFRGDAAPNDDVTFAAAYIK